MKRTILLTLMVCLTAGIVSAAMEKGPYLIYPGVNDEMQVLWQVSGTETGTLEWGETTSYTDGSVNTTQYGSDNQHAYTITGLTPGVKYYYRVYASSAWRTGSFTAAPADVDVGNVKFLLYGDTRTNPGDQNKVTDDMIDTYTADPDYQTIALHSGDWVNSNSESNWTSQFFSRSYSNNLEFQANVPINGCIGNHEGSGSVYEKYYPYPYVNDFYWSFDYGPVHVAIVDEYTSYSPGSTQGNWLEDDLASTTKEWKIIVMHQPGWSAGSHGNDTSVQNYIQPLCLTYGVELVIYGHNHNYSRGLVNGVHHVTTGGGGAPRYGIDTGWPYIVTAESTLNYCTIDVQGYDLTLTAMRSSANTQIESFTINHTPPIPPGPATNPDPAHLATDVSVNADITWSAGLGATSHDVYFGIDSTPDAGEFIGNQAPTTYDPGLLVASTTYYFRIDEVNAADTTAGSVWNFTTQPAILPGTPTLLLPTDTDTYVSTKVMLSWTAASDTDEYEVFFGPTSGSMSSQGLTSDTTMVVTASSDLTEYEWQVVAKNVFGDSSSTIFTYTTAELLSGEDFELASGIGPDWLNVAVGDNYDWTNNSGGTASSNTGPSSGANGSTYYAYLECSDGSGAFLNGDNAILESGLIGGTDRTLTFYYHMYGGDIGSLYVDVHDGVSWTNELTITGQQHTSNGAAYTPAIVDLSGYTGDIQVRFDAVAIGGYLGDTAIDDIKVEGLDVVLPTTPPSNPSPADSATGVSTSTIVSWDPGDNATSYDVYFGTDPTPDNDGGSSEFIGNQPGTSYDPGPLALNTTYYWQIISVNDEYTSDGPIWSFHTNSAPTWNNDPTVKAGALVGAAYAGTLAGDVDDVDGGALTITKDSGPIWLSIASNGTLSGTPLVGDLGLNSWGVTVTDNKGDSSSATLEIDVSELPPTAPSNPSPVDVATGVNIALANISWDAGSYATSYDVYFGTDPTPDNDGGSSEFKGNQAGLSYAPEPLALDTTYYWQVVSINSEGSAAGPVWSFHTNSAPTWDNDPTITANAIVNGAYSESLAGDVDDVDGGALTITKGSFTGPGSDWLTIAIDGGLSGMPALGNLGLNSWNVTVTDDQGNSAGATLEITVIELPPLAPINPTPADSATGVNIALANISWTAGSYATSYDVYFGTDPTPDNDGGSSEFKGNQAELSYAPGPLVLDTTYYWQVVSINGEGTAASVVWSFHTNAAPTWNSDPATKAGALDGKSYSDNLSGDVNDVDGGALSFTKNSYSSGTGTDWLTIATNGALTGTPDASNEGTNEWDVIVTDDQGNSTSATVRIEVYVLHIGFYGMDDFKFFAEVWMIADCGACNGANLVDDDDDGVPIVDIYDLIELAKGWLPKYVPGVIDTPQATAFAAIADAGLVASVSSSEYNPIVAGNVISSDPIAGSELKYGESVTLVISLGPEAAVPDVIGDLEAVGTGKITDALLALGVRTESYDGAITIGRIISTNPIADGTLYPAGTPVDYVVSLGTMVPLPDVVGLTEAAAISAIEVLGFTAGVTYEYDESIAVDLVISQNPTYPGTAPYESTVDIVVSLGPVPIVILEENDNQDDKVDVKDGQDGAQSFEHGNDFIVTSVELKLSRESDSPSDDLHFAIGTSINGGTIAGTAYDITPSSVTDTTDGNTFMDYTITFASPVGPLNGGTTYYLNVETGGNGKAYFLGYNGDSDYSDGDYFKNGSGEGKDIYFKVSGYED